MSDIQNMDKLIEYFVGLGFGYGGIKAVLQHGKTFEYQVSFTIRPNQIEKLIIKKQ